MTRSVEIPEAAVEAAFRSWNGLHVGTAKDRLYDALAAALPYLAPAEPQPVRAHERDSEVDGLVIEGLSGKWHQDGPDDAHPREQCSPYACGWEALQQAPLTLAPVGDGGLREALIKAIVSVSEPEGSDCILGREYVENYADVFADAVLAVLAGEQEQVER